MHCSFPEKKSRLEKKLRKSVQEKKFSPEGLVSGIILGGCSNDEQGDQMSL
jgi:hypothetical protein